MITNDDDYTETPKAESFPSEDMPKDENKDSSFGQSSSQKGNKKIKNSGSRQLWKRPNSHGRTRES